MCDPCAMKVFRGKRRATLGLSWQDEPTPNGVAPEGGEHGHNPVGVETGLARFPRVARRLATLGWRTQSLWDWPNGKPELWVTISPRGRGGDLTPLWEV